MSGTIDIQDIADTTSAQNVLVQIPEIENPEAKKNVGNPICSRSVLIGGGDGFVGRALSLAFENAGWRVVLLSRKIEKGKIFWNADDGILDEAELENFNAVVCLSGENIFGRWTGEKKRKILQSRKNTAALLAQKICSAKLKPDVFICASAVGFYGINPTGVCDETSPVGEGFLADVCREWEIAADIAKGCTRVVNARFGLVFDLSGGALQKMVESAAKFKISVQFGACDRKISWISLRDLCAAIIFACENKNLDGAVNFCSPQSTRAGVLANLIKQNSRAFFKIAIPAFAAKIFGGEMAENLLLSDCETLPKRLESAGFIFKDTDIEKFFLQSENKA